MGAEEKECKSADSKAHQEKTYYTILGVKPNSGEAEFSAAYKKLSEEYDACWDKYFSEMRKRFEEVCEVDEVLSNHEKKEQSEESSFKSYAEAGERFKEVREANEVLSNHEKRIQYDFHRFVISGNIIANINFLSNCIEENAIKCAARPEADILSRTMPFDYANIFCKIIAADYPYFEKIYNAVQNYNSREISQKVTSNTLFGMYNPFSLLIKSLPDKPHGSDDQLKKLRTLAGFYDSNSVFILLNAATQIALGDSGPTQKFSKIAKRLEYFLFKLEQNLGIDLFATAAWLIRQSLIIINVELPPQPFNVASVLMQNTGSSPSSSSSSFSSSSSSLPSLLFSSSSSFSSSPLSSSFSSSPSLFSPPLSSLSSPSSLSQEGPFNFSSKLSMPQSDSFSRPTQSVPSLQDMKEILKQEKQIFFQSLNNKEMIVQNINFLEQCIKKDAKNYGLILNALGLNVFCMLITMPLKYFNKIYSALKTYNSHQGPGSRMNDTRIIFCDRNPFYLLFSTSGSFSKRNFPIAIKKLIVLKEIFGENYRSALLAGLGKQMSENRNYARMFQNCLCVLEEKFPNLTEEREVIVQALAGMNLDSKRESSNLSHSSFVASNPNFMEQHRTGMNLDSKRESSNLSHSSFVASNPNFTEQHRTGMNLDSKRESSDLSPSSFFASSPNFTEQHRTGMNLDSKRESSNLRPSSFVASNPNFTDQHRKRKRVEEPTVEGASQTSGSSSFDSQGPGFFSSSQPGRGQPDASTSMTIYLEINVLLNDLFSFIPGDNNSERYSYVQRAKVAFSNSDISQLENIYRELLTRKKLQQPPEIIPGGYIDLT